MMFPPPQYSSTCLPAYSSAIQPALLLARASSCFISKSRMYPFLVLISLLILPQILLQAQIGFTENGGQWPEQVQFRAQVSGGSLFIEENAFTWHFQSQPDVIQNHGHQQSKNTEQEYLLGHAIKIHFEGAEKALQFSGLDKMSGYTNFLLGSDKSKWAGHLHSYQRLEGQWAEGIELAVYSQSGNTKYDFILEPGFNKKTIKKLRFRYEGADGIKLEDGKVKIRTSINELVEATPYAYQDLPEGRVKVACDYTLKNNVIGFEFPQGYNVDYPLIIDPATWVFGSYSGSISDNWGYSAAFDSNGNLFGAGIVFGAGYPVSLGAYQEDYVGGTCDIAITKFSADGTLSLWATYLGGSAPEFPHSILANSKDELWIYGTTSSNDFPLADSAYDNSFNGGIPVIVSGVNFLNGSDIYVSRLSEDGADLLASTYLGGTLNDGLNTSGNTQFNYGDHARGEIISDGSGNAYVGSCSFSADFPTTPGAYSNFNSGGQDGIVFKLDSTCTNLYWSSYLGGANGENVSSIVLEPDSNIIMTGGTGSINFPFTASALDTSYNGGTTDGWAGRISKDGSTLLASTFLGTSAYDQSYFIARDFSGNVYVTGQSLGSFLVTPGVYSNPASGQFITKLKYDLDTVIYSTVYGSGNSFFDISPTAFLVDVCENVYISGWGGTTNSAGGSTTGLPVTFDAIQDITDGSDFYYAVFKRDMEDLEYATFYGGPISREHVDGGTSRFDKQGVVYQAVCAGCGSNDDFPTTPGVVSNINGSGNCNLGVAKFKLDFTGVFAGIGAPTIGCAPLEIDFINTSSAASFYIWDFGGGDLSTVFEPSRTYSDIGTYIVNLIAIDSNSCNIADTATIIITVHEDSVEALFDVLETDFCDSLRVDFTNNSSFVSSAGYIWNFGDGTFSFFESPSHTYTSPGTYTISLVVNDITSCNVWDTAYYEVTVLERAIAQFNAPPGGCVPYNLVFLNTSFGVDPSFFWDFGDGNISTTPIPVHTYNTSGTYTATLIIIDLLSCNLTDTFQVVIDVNPNPIAAFNALPEIGSIFQEFEFEDLSVSGIQSWDWDFGDGTTSAQQNPFHMYSEIGFFDVCLTVVNEFGCADSTCVRIAMDSTSQLLFPNAFSPNGDGQNDIFLPFNWGLENYHLQIFNRWGELVFETSLEDDGWDGTWKGKDQDQGMFKVVAAGDGLDGQRYRAVSDLFLIR